MTSVKSQELIDLVKIDDVLKSQKIKLENLYNPKYTYEEIKQLYRKNKIIFQANKTICNTLKKNIQNYVKRLVKSYEKNKYINLELHFKATNTKFFSEDLDIIGTGIKYDPSSFHKIKLGIHSLNDNEVFITVTPKFLNLKEQGIPVKYISNMTPNSGGNNMLTIDASIEDALYVSLYAVLQLCFVPIKQKNNLYKHFELAS